MMKRTYLTITALGVAAPALGQIGAVDSEYPSYEPSAAVKNGYTAEDLRDVEVRGVNGDRIGEIEDLIIGPNGQLRRLIVSVNEGWFGTGGRQLAVNWEDVNPGPKTAENDYELQYVTVPVTKRNVEEFGLFKDKLDAVKGRAREWRASELIGDYINLKDMDDAGTVSDLMFDKQGELRAIAAAPDVSGSILVPFYAEYSGDDEGWDPGDEYYEVPYTSKEIAELLPEKQRAQAANSDSKSQRTRVSRAEGNEPDSTRDPEPGKFKGADLRSAPMPNREDANTDMVDPYQVPPDVDAGMGTRNTTSEIDED